MFAAWFAGALFIPSMALAMGVWSGSSKLFEAVYTVWWYLGPLHQMPSLDFVGGTRASSSAGLYLALAAGLLLAACLGRRRQVAYA
jgi:ammonia channel protein AmtB